MPPRLRASIKRSASPGRPIGYAREGAGEQSLALQLAALQKAGCAQVFTDQARGAGAGRPGLNDALSQLRPGDTLVVWNLGRLGGGVKGLVDLVNALAGREAHFRSLSDDIDTQASAGRFFFHVMARLAQMERELIVERTHAGLAVARKLGRVGGAQTPHDRQQDQRRAAATRRRHDCARGRRQPRRVRANAIPMAARLGADLAIVSASSPLAHGAPLWHAYPCLGGRDSRRPAAVTGHSLAAAYAPKGD